MTKNILVIGHSHIYSIRNAYKEHKFASDFHFIDLRLFVPVVDSQGVLNPLLKFELNKVFTSMKPDLLITAIAGNDHNVFSILNSPEPFDFCLKAEPEVEINEKCEIVSESLVKSRLELKLKNKVLNVNKLISEFYRIPLYILEPPPPVPEDHIHNYPGVFIDKIKECGVSPLSLRYKFWRVNSSILKDFCTENQFGFIQVPSGCLNKEGSLVDKALNQDPTHGNSWYGRKIIDQIARICKTTKSEKIDLNPYRNLPNFCFWKRSVVEVKKDQVDPVVNVSFKISSDDKVVTAGSCFAQHIAKHLRKNGFNYYVTETGHESFSEASLKPPFNYGIFSARYGNIYTAAQLLQLLLRATNEFIPNEEYWSDKQGNIIDPFRPQIQPDGFGTVQELQVDRKNHLTQVLRAFKNMDVFAFTLGLTEAWVSKEDGSVFPLCPGVAGGVFEPEKYAFKNYNVSEVISDLTTFFKKLKRINSKCKVILTVSPVPLIATFEDRHVINSTSYSKSVLRVACEELSKEFEYVSYFPSFEIITSHYTHGAYFSDDLRSVTEEGVNHVMSLFLKNYTKSSMSQAKDSLPKSKETLDHLKEVQDLLEIVCDEEALDND